MHVVVTGGTGFIGTALCRRLLDAGYRVSVLTRDRDRARRHFSGRIAPFESMDEIPADQAPDAVVNLAGRNLGSGRWTRARKRAFVTSRVDVTRHVVDYLSRIPAAPRVLISQSAVGYYGARGDEPLDEDQPPGREYQSELCRRWEDAARRAADAGVRVCIARSGVVLGHGGALSGLVPMFEKGLGASVGSGRQWISWIHMEDLLVLYLRMLVGDLLSGAFNNTAPNPVTNREFAETLGQVLGRPARLRVPGWLIRVGMGEMARLYLTGQRVIPRRHLEAGYRFHYPNLGPALSQILAQDRSGGRR